MGKGVAVIYRRRKGENRHQSTALLLVSAAFLLGGVLGWLAEERLPSAQYVQSFLEAAGEGSLTSGVWRECWMTLRWPVGVILLGALSSRTVPVILCLRGFLLSYSIAAFVEAAPWSAVLLFGPTCVLTLPVLFLLSTEILLRKAGERTAMRPAVILACLLALCLCMALDLMAVPILLA